MLSRIDCIFLLDTLQKREEVNELIKQYGLEEDGEHVIIPLPGRGKTRRCFLLKRRFMRIAYPDGRYVDYPLARVIEATMRFPEMQLSEALHLIQAEFVADEPDTVAEREEHEEKNTG